MLENKRHLEIRTRSDQALQINRGMRTIASAVGRAGGAQAAQAPGWGKGVGGHLHVEKL